MRRFENDKGEVAVTAGTQTPGLHMVYREGQVGYPVSRSGCISEYMSEIGFKEVVCW